MKLLITGAHGQVAQEVVDADTAKQIEFVALSHGELDITKPSQIETALKEHKPDFLINCAAYTAVDKIESDQDVAFAINALGPQLLAIHCARQNIPLLHISTDYVFSGEQSQPYLETDKPDPINIYGKSKLLGEKFVTEAWEKHIILRVSSVFSSHSTNFVKTIFRLAHEKEALTVVEDQISSPTAAKDIAEALLQICKTITQNPDRNLWGIYHYVGNPGTSWYHFAEKIVSEAKKYGEVSVKTISPIKRIDYKTPATRPANSVLNCDKFAKTFDLKPAPWFIEFEQVIKNLSHEKLST